jgi:hypothetical protein
MEHRAARHGAPLGYFLPLASQRIRRSGQSTTHTNTRSISAVRFGPAIAAILLVCSAALGRKTDPVTAPT